jgi:hypothetical protein
MAAVMVMANLRENEYRPDSAGLCPTAGTACTNETDAEEGVITNERTPPMTTRSAQLSSQGQQPLLRTEQDRSRDGQH